MLSCRSLRQEFAGIGNASRNSGGGSDQRTRQHGAHTRALAAFEIAIAGADHELPGLADIAIHAKAHRAAGFAPFGAGGAEDVVKTFALGITLDLFGTGHDEHA